MARGAAEVMGLHTLRRDGAWLAVRRGWLLLLAAALSGCAAGIPRAISETPATAVTVSEVQQTESRFIGVRVRWGGTILSVRNLEAVTEIEILARPIDARGEPDPEREGQGRFIATVRGFLDPSEYPKDRLLTIVGTLDRVETRPVGDYPYRFPIVNTMQRYLWPEPVPDAYPYPYYPYGYLGLWRHPWYGPWWGPGYYW